MRFLCRQQALALLLLSTFLPPKGNYKKRTRLAGEEMFHLPFINYVRTNINKTQKVASTKDFFDKKKLFSARKSSRFSTLGGVFQRKSRFKTF